LTPSAIFCSVWSVAWPLTKAASSWSCRTVLMVLNAGTVDSVTTCSVTVVACCAHTFTRSGRVAYCRSAAASVLRVGSSMACSQKYFIWSSLAANRRNAAARSAFFVALLATSAWPPRSEAAPLSRGMNVTPQSPL
jgi:hypothetical protein